MRGSISEKKYVCKKIEFVGNPLGYQIDLESIEQDSDLLKNKIIFITSEEKVFNEFSQDKNFIVQFRKSS